MSSLSRYTGIKIPKYLTNHLLAMLKFYIPEDMPDMSINNKTSIEYLKKADMYLSSNPYNFGNSMCFSVKELVYDAVKEHVQNQQISKQLSQDEIQEWNEHPEEYMATHFGISY